MYDMYIAVLLLIVVALLYGQKVKNDAEKNCCTKLVLLVLYVKSMNDFGICLLKRYLEKKGFKILTKSHIMVMLVVNRLPGMRL